MNSDVIDFITIAISESPAAASELLSDIASLFHLETKTLELTKSELDALTETAVIAESENFSLEQIRKQFSTSLESCLHTNNALN